MRNPFQIRAAQRSISDEEFVKLFGSGVFEVMKEVENPWDGLVFLRSAPGGGKTTLLRMLTPRPLELATHQLTENPQVKSTHDRLVRVGAIFEGKPQILGVMVVFTPEYRELAEYDLGNSLFRELVSSRIVISMLRTLLARSKRVYPRDLGTINIEWEPESDATIPAKANGRDLFEWASEIENGFYERMDDLGDPCLPKGGHARLDGLTWLAKAMVEDANGPVTAKRVLLLDEIQQLSREQRLSLIEYLTNARGNCGVWVAERLEALNHRDLLSEGALKQRDYEQVIQLERRWVGARTKTYAKFVKQIADLRAAKAEGFGERDFYSWIAESDDESHWDPIYESACEDIRRRIEDRVRGDARYRGWIEDAARVEGDSWEKALRWRKTEILVEQEIRRIQGALPFYELTEKEFDDRARRIDRAAEHFLRTELEAPIYFGQDAIASVSSSNVDQYLEVAGELFAELDAKFGGPRDQPSVLTTDRQNAIIRRVAERRWEGLTRRLPYGAAAKQLLMAFEAYSKQQTFRPTAPYAPGVTGFAITMAERKMLIDSPDDEVRHLCKLRDVLTSLVAHNLLIPHLDHRQGGRAVVIFYLNRLLCVQFGLPLWLGGWRHKSLGELNTWLEKGPVGVPESARGKLV